MKVRTVIKFVLGRCPSVNKNIGSCKCKWYCGVFMLNGERVYGIKGVVKNRNAVETQLVGINK
jgi:hypothetical protein